MPAISHYGESYEAEITLCTQWLSEEREGERCVGLHSNVVEIVVRLLSPGCVRMHMCCMSTIASPGEY